MKKVLGAVAAVLAACMLFAFVACGAEDVDGKTFVYDKIEASGEGADLIVGTMEESFKGMEISFKDGKMTGMGGEQEYTQDGDKIKVSGVEVAKVSGDSIVMEQSQGGITIKIYFKAK